MELDNQEAASGLWFQSARKQRPTSPPKNVQQWKSAIEDLQSRLHPQESAAFARCTALRAVREMQPEMFTACLQSLPVSTELLVSHTGLRKNFTEFQFHHRLPDFVKTRTDQKWQPSEHWFEAAEYL